MPFLITWLILTLVFNLMLVPFWIKTLNKVDNADYSHIEDRVTANLVDWHSLHSPDNSYPDTMKVGKYEYVYNGKKHYINAETSLANVHIPGCVHVDLENDRMPETIEVVVKKSGGGYKRPESDTRGTCLGILGMGFVTFIAFIIAFIFTGSSIFA